MAGFSTPILHGLCSLGFATRLVLRVYGDKLAKNLRSVRCRFSSPVIPGQTLIVEMWQNQNQILFTAKVEICKIVRGPKNDLKNYYEPTNVFWNFITLNGIKIIRELKNE